MLRNEAGAGLISRDSLPATRGDPAVHAWELGIYEESAH